jgi:hypothetical protein
MASLRTLSTALLLVALAQGRPLTEATAKPARRVTGGDCDCYKAAANSSAHFVNRKFFDFRNIANPVTPAPITGQQADAAAGYTHISRRPSGRTPGRCRAGQRRAKACVG